MKKSGKGKAATASKERTGAEPGNGGKLQRWAQRIDAKVCIIFDRSGYNHAGVERACKYVEERF